MGTRSQPYRLKWPLSPTQVEGADEMFQILFKAVRAIEGSLIASIDSNQVPYVGASANVNLGAFNLTTTGVITAASFAGSGIGLTGLVPYTGAVSNVDLGLFSLSLPLIISNATTGAIVTNTADGSDNHRWQLAGGGGSGGDFTRGGYITVYGNEFTGEEGNVLILAGTVAGAGKGEIQFFVNATQVVTINNVGSLIASNLATLGTMKAPDGAVAAPSYGFTSTAGLGFYQPFAGGYFGVTNGGVNNFLFGPTGNFYFSSIGKMQWTTGATNAATDLMLQRSAAKTLSIDDGAGGAIVLKVVGSETLTGKITNYNSIATVAGGVPVEYATIDSTALAANVAATTMYAVPASGAGMYRISAYVVETTAGSLSSTLPNVQILYTDNDTGGVITLDATPILGIAGIGQTGALTANTVGTASSGVVSINAKASTNIQYQTVNYASNLAGMAYALHIKLEAM